MSPRPFGHWGARHDRSIAAGASGSDSDSPQRVAEITSLYLPFGAGPPPARRSYRGFRPAAIQRRVEHREVHTDVRPVARRQMAARPTGERALVVIAAAAVAGDRITARLVDEAYRAGAGLDLVSRARFPPIARGGVAVALAGGVGPAVCGVVCARTGI